MNKKIFSPQDTIFLWDLHEVILQKSLWEWFTIGMQFDRKKELLQKLDKKSAYLALSFVLERLGIIKKQLVSQELVQAALNAHNHALADLTIEMCSSYTPIVETINLMQELTTLGYKHHLASNIGEAVFTQCQTKFTDIFSLFQSHTIPFHCPKNGFIKKPHPYFFHAHLTKNNLISENVIFIDDKKINVAAAQAVGMYGIEFKNAQQLRTHLQELTIL